MLVPAIVRGFIDLFDEDCGEDFRRPIQTRLAAKGSKTATGRTAGDRGLQDAAINRSETPYSRTEAEYEPRAVNQRVEFPIGDTGRVDFHTAYIGAVLLITQSVRRFLRQCR